MGLDTVKKKRVLTGNRGKKILVVYSEVFERLHVAKLVGTAYILIFSFRKSLT